MLLFFFFKQKTAYEMRISDWSSDVCSSDLQTPASVDVVDGSQIRARQPGINLSEGLAAVPGLQIQNRQNYAQDLQVSIRGFGEIGRASCRERVCQYV